jgi:hypothetical protein
MSPAVCNTKENASLEKLGKTVERYCKISARVDEASTSTLVTPPSGKYNSIFSCKAKYSGKPIYQTHAN